MDILVLEVQTGDTKTVFDPLRSKGGFTRWPHRLETISLLPGTHPVLKRELVYDSALHYPSNQTGAVYKHLEGSQ